MSLKITMPDPSTSALSQPPQSEGNITASGKPPAVSAHRPACANSSLAKVVGESAPTCSSPDLSLTSPESLDESTPRPETRTRKLSQFPGPISPSTVFNSPPTSPPAKPFVTHTIERSVSPSSVDAAAALLTLSIKHKPTNSVSSTSSADEILDRVQENLENAHSVVRGDDQRRRRFLQILQSAIGVLASDSAPVSPKTTRALPDGPLRPLSANIPARNSQNGLEPFKWHQRQDLMGGKQPGMVKPFLSIPPQGPNYVPVSPGRGPAPLPVAPNTPYNHGAPPMHSMVQPQVYPPPMYYGYDGPPQVAGQRPPPVQLSSEPSAKIEGPDDPKYSSGTSILSASAAYKRRRKQRKTTKCHECGTTETPEWRRGPDGARTLCNACGLYHAKLAKKWGDAEATELLKERASQRKRPVW